MIGPALMPSASSTSSQKTPPRVAAKNRVDRRRFHSCVDIQNPKDVEEAYRTTLREAYAAIAFELGRLSDDIAHDWLLPHRKHIAWPRRCDNIVRTLMEAHRSGDVGTTPEGFRRSLRLPWSHAGVSGDRHALALHLWAKAVYNAVCNTEGKIDLVPVTCDAVANNTASALKAHSNSFDLDDRNRLMDDINKLRAAGSSAREQLRALG